jgi:hypothetical protein
MKKPVPYNDEAIRRFHPGPGLRARPARLPKPLKQLERELLELAIQDNLYREDPFDPRRKLAVAIAARRSA